MKFQATFEPQAWVNDYAIPVDPEGPTQWDCTSFIEEQKLVDRVMPAIEKDGVWLDKYDRLKEDANSPEWIREWTGPFSIYVSTSK